MNNVLLGKTLKAMYKQSGKTITQLSDETDLSIDTINNLFYARVQKPGLSDVDTLIRVMGFHLTQLMEFLEQEHPSDCDITAEFAKYIFSVNDTPVERLPTSLPASTTAEDIREQKFSAQIQMLNTEHEKQLDRFRATHLRYVEQIQNLYKEQLARMEDSMRNDATLLLARRINRILGITVCVETIALILLSFYHV